MGGFVHFGIGGQMGHVVVFIWGVGVGGQMGHVVVFIWGVVVGGLGRLVVGGQMGHVVVFHGGVVVGGLGIFVGDVVVCGLGHVVVDVVVAGLGHEGVVVCGLGHVVEDVVVAGVGHVVVVVGDGHVVVVVGLLVVVVIVPLQLDLMSMGRHLQTSLQEGQWRMGAHAQDLQISSILRGLQGQRQILGIVHVIFLGTHRHLQCTHGSPTVKFIGRPLISSIVRFPTFLSVSSELGSPP